LAAAGLALVIAVHAYRSAPASRAYHGIAITYVLAILVISSLIAVRAEDNRYLRARQPVNVNYQAARWMPMNTRIADADLRAPDDLPPGYFWSLPDVSRLRGRYVRKLYRPGDDIDPNALLPRPALPPKVQFVRIADPKMAAVLNAGARVELCADTCLTPMFVAAVYCADDVCYAAVARDEGLTDKHTIRLLSLP
jgi:hypothetical protein